jgi:hypothetical protein
MIVSSGGERHGAVERKKEAASALVGNKQKAKKVERYEETLKTVSRYSSFGRRRASSLLFFLSARGDSADGSVLAWQRWRTGFGKDDGRIVG